MKKSRQAESHVLTMPLPASSPAPSQVGQDVTDRDISRRAYQRFLERGAGHGHDLDDWLEAERELRQPATPQVA